MPGQVLQNDYRSFGTITRLTKAFDFGDVQAGVWYDHQYNVRALRLSPTCPTPACRSIWMTPIPAPTTGGVDRLLVQNLQTFQPYAQLDWNITDALSVTPGVRYMYFDRSVDASVNVKSAATQNYDNTFGTLLPSISAHYTFTPNWTSALCPGGGGRAGAQREFLQPAIADHHQPGAGKDLELPDRYLHSASRPDAFRRRAYLYIAFTNFIASHVVGAETVFFNLGGAKYMGLEAEATYMIGHGFSLYANGSLNSAKDNITHQWLPNAPETTGAIGGIFSQDGLYASLLGKWVGSRFGDVGQTQGLQPIFTLDGSVSYELSHLFDGIKQTTVQLQVNNITDTTKIINLARLYGGRGHHALPGGPSRRAVCSSPYRHRSERLFMHSPAA